MKYTLLFLFVSLLFTACEKEEECAQRYLANVQDVIAPANGIVNEAIPIAVFFGTSNGCQKFNRFIAKTEGNKITIGTEMLEEGCLCSAVATLQQEIYEFTALAPGDYQLNFNALDSSTEINITIE